jgi:hypothetical protein
MLAADRIGRVIAQAVAQLCPTDNVGEQDAQQPVGCLSPHARGSVDVAKRC